MKNMFSSVTIWGAIIALLAKFAGVEVSSAETSTLIDKVQWLWPVLLAMVADAGTILARVKATKFNVPAWRSKVFWTQIASGCLTIAAAFGFDLTIFQGLIEKGLDAWPAILALAGTVISLYGRFSAKKKIA